MYFFEHYQIYRPQQQILLLLSLNICLYLSLHIMKYKFNENLGCGESYVQIPKPVGKQKPLLSPFY